MAAEGRRKPIGTRRSPPRERSPPPVRGDDRGRGVRGRGGPPGRDDRNGAYRDRSPLRDTYAARFVHTYLIIHVTYSPMQNKLEEKCAPMVKEFRIGAPLSARAHTGVWGCTHG